MIHTNSQQAGAKVNLLLVADQPANLLALEAALHDPDYHLVKAPSDDEALKRLLSEDFAVIILDLSTPGPAGFETAQLIRGRERSRRTPIIFLLAYETSDFPLTWALNLGVVDCLVRPLQPAVLKAKVAGYVELFRKAEQIRQLEQRQREHQLIEERQRAELRRWQERAEAYQRAAEKAAPPNYHPPAPPISTHDPHNALTPILKGLNLLRLTEDDELAAEQARQMIERQGRHLARLVDDLLDLLRLRRGKDAPHRERLDLAQLVRAVAEEHRIGLEQVGLDLTLDVPRTPVWLPGNAAQLTRALGVLLDHRAPAPDGRGHVSVRLTIDADRRLATITVHHSGLGVEPELLPRLLDVFACAEAGWPTLPGGRGLGLALLRELIGGQGGEVQVFSAGPGQGLDMTMRLPLEAEPLALTETPPAAAPQAHQLHRGSIRLRILVAEDNRESAESLRLLLGMLGHDVLVVHSGTEAVKAAVSWRPQLMLCDIGLPGLNGYEVGAALRRNPATAQIRLIAVTGFGEDEDRRRCQEAGFDHHLTKPVDPQVLEAMVALQTLVAHRGMGR